MSQSLPQPPDLDPTALSNPTLGRARRGFEPAEVNQLLGRGADALRAWQEYGQRLRNRIEDLEGELVEAHKLDEGRIASVLGEETARIISAAREAAAEIRAKASEDAERLIREAEETSTATANALTAEAEALRAEAETMRDDAAREYASKIDAARERHDELLAEGQTRRDAMVAEATARHDELISEAQTRHATLISEGTSRHEELISQAQVRHDELVEAAEGVLAERTADATTAAETILEDARSQGRTMVAEAKAVRDRILADLAERRRIARRQIEGAVAGRDSIVELLRAAGSSVESIIADLNAADAVAQERANQVTGAMDDDSMEFLASLDVDLSAVDAISQVDPTEHDVDEPGDIDGAADTDVEPVVSQDTVEVIGEADEQATLRAVEDEDTAHENQPVESTDADTTNAPETDAPSDTEDVMEDPSDTEPDGGGSEQGTASSGDATVHDLFARIRAQELDEAEAAGSVEGEEIDPYDDLDADEEFDDDEITDDEDDEPADQLDSDEDGVVIDLAAADISGAGSGDDEAADSGSADDATADGGDELSRVVELLDARDELLVPVERQMLRALRRLASDEQNEVLDRLRRIKRGRPDMDDVIPTADEMIVTFSDGIIADFSAAVRAGFDFWIDAGGLTEMATFVVPADVRDRLETTVSAFISLHRAHLEKAMQHSAEAGTGTDELMSAIKAVYRDWRQASLTEMAGDLAIAGFSHGERTAAGPGVPWMWVVDNGGLPCADGEDNALAGAVLSDEAFPTGDLFPPAHSGCRCILVPADN